MSLTKRNIPQTFEDAQKLLGNRDERRIGKTAVLFREHRMTPSNASIALKLHNTVIVRWFGNGDVYVKHGGWVTTTTASWLNHALPPGFRVHRHRGDMILSSTWRGYQFVMPSTDVVITPSGYVRTLPA